MQKEKEIPVIEVTPQMIQAGYEVLRQSGIQDSLEGVDRLLVEEILQAALEAGGLRLARLKDEKYKT